MNALTAPKMFQSAYRQISQAERAFVDQFVNAAAEYAERQGHSVRLVLQRELPSDLSRIDPRGWLARPLVQAAITEQVTLRADDDEITPQGVIREINMLARARISDFYDVDELGNPYVDTEAVLTHPNAGAIKSIEFEASDSPTRIAKHKLKITMHDKTTALKMAAAYAGLDDADNPQRRADRAAQAPALATDATIQDAEAAYASMLGD